MPVNPVLAYHPYCLAMPRMDADSFAARREDYRRHPERAHDQQVVLAEDKVDGQWKIADARHHYEICNELGYECEFTRYTGTDAELIAFLEARGFNRRAATHTQRVAWRLTVSPETAPPLHKLAEDAHVSRSTAQRVYHAAQVEPALLPAMLAGTLDGKTADRVAHLSAAERRAVVDAPDPKAEADRVAPPPPPRTHQQVEASDPGWVEDGFDQLEMERLIREGMELAPPDPDHTDGPDDDEPVSRETALPAPTSNSPRPPEPLPDRRPLPKHFTPGGKSNADHAYADLLNGIQALTVRLTKALNALPADDPHVEKLRSYLAFHGWVVFRDKIKVNADGDAKHYGHQFTGLRGLRRVIDKAGGPGKPMTKEKYAEWLKKQEEQEAAR